ncbi:UNVERIFIED_CONTAM: hypothetical protein Sindi_2705100 [Sesamum indicum]
MVSIASQLLYCLEAAKLSLFEFINTVGSSFGKPRSRVKRQTTQYDSPCYGHLEIDDRDLFLTLCWFIWWGHDKRAMEAEYMPPDHITTSAHSFSQASFLPAQGQCMLL